MKMEHGLKTLVLRLNLILIVLFSQLTFGKTLKLDAITSTSGTQDIVVTTTADLDLDVNYLLGPTGNFNDATIRDRATPTTDTGFGINGTTGTVYTLVGGSQKMAVNTTRVQFFNKAQFLLSPQSPTALGLQLGETGVKNTGAHAEDSDADLLLTADSVDVLQLESTQGISLLDWTFNGSATVEGEAILETSVVMTQIATPSNPSASTNKLYFKSDDNLYILDSSGTEDRINYPLAQIATLDYSGARVALTTTVATTMNLDTVAGDTAIISLSANQFTLQAGKYTIDWFVMHYHVSTNDEAKSYIYNTTAAADVGVRGTRTFSASAGVKLVSYGSETLTYGSAQVLELRAYKIGAGTVYYGDVTGEKTALVRITKWD